MFSGLKKRILGRFGLSGSAAPIAPAAPADPGKALSEKWDEEFKTHGRPSILICGYTGTGKTSLIRAIFGKDIVSDALIGHGKPCTKAFDKYENDLLVIYDSKGFEPRQSEDEFASGVKDFIAERQAGSAAGLQTLWYTIQGPGARVTSTDLKLLKELLPAGAIAVITKRDISKDEQVAAIRDALTNGGVPARRIIEVSEYDLESLKRLSQLTRELLPENLKDSFLSAQIVDLDAKRARARKIIHSAAAAAAAVGGANPFPLTDSAILTPLQGALIGSLAYFYGMSKAAAIHVFSPLLAELAGVSLATTLTKIVPGLGGLVNAAVAGALTEAVGWIAQRHFEACAKARLAGRPEPVFEMPGIPVFRSLLEEALKRKRG